MASVFQCQTIGLVVIDRFYVVQHEPTLVKQPVLVPCTKFSLQCQVVVKRDGIVPNCSCGKLLTHKQVPQKCNAGVHTQKRRFPGFTAIASAPFVSGKEKGVVVGGELELAIK